MFNLQKQDDHNNNHNNNNNENDNVNDNENDNGQGGEEREDEKQQKRRILYRENFDVPEFSDHVHPALKACVEKLLSLDSAYDIAGTCVGMLHAV